MSLNLEKEIIDIVDEDLKQILYKEDISIKDCYFQINKYINQIENNYSDEHNSTTERSEALKEAWTELIEKYEQQILNSGISNTQKYSMDTNGSLNPAYYGISFVVKVRKAIADIRTEFNKKRNKIYALSDKNKMLKDIKNILLLIEKIRQIIGLPEIQILVALYDGNNIKVKTTNEDKIKDKKINIKLISLSKILNNLTLNKKSVQNSGFGDFWNLKINSGGLKAIFNNENTIMSFSALDYKENLKAHNNTQAGTVLERMIEAQISGNNYQFKHNSISGLSTGDLNVQINNKYYSYSVKSFLEASPSYLSVNNIMKTLRSIRDILIENQNNENQSIITLKQRFINEVFKYKISDNLIDTVTEEMAKILTIQ